MTEQEIRPSNQDNYEPTSLSEPELKLQLFPIPATNAEATQVLHPTVQSLIDHPESLTQFVRQIQHSSHVYPDGKPASRLTSYCEKIRRETSHRHDWENEANKQITPKEAHSLLDTLTTLEHQPETHINTHLKAITTNIIAGYINLRYSKTKDWRGSLRTLHTFLQGATLDTTNIDILSLWFDITTGDRTDIIPKQSIAWQAPALGIRDAHILERDVLEQATNLDSCTSMLANIFETHERFRKRSESYRQLATQYEKISIIHAVLLSSDPSASIAIGFNHPEYERLKQFDAQQLTKMLKRFPPHLVEAVTSSMVFLPEYNALHQAITQSHHALGNTSAIMDNFSSPEGRTLPFPHNIFMATTPELDRLAELFDASTVKDELIELAEKSAAQNGYMLIPFAQHGISGWIGVTENSALLRLEGQELANTIEQLLEQENVIKRWQQQISTHTSRIISAIILDGLDPNERRVYYLTTKAFQPKSELDVFLETKFPESTRAHALETLREILELRRTIPPTFNKSLTHQGHFYDVRTNEHLPGVFESIIMRLQSPGRFSFSFKFVKDSQFPDIPGNIHGFLHLSHGLVETTFAPDTTLPSHIEWFLTKHILKLFMTKCCVDHGLIPTLEDTDQQETNLPLDHDYPGRIVHIGATKQDGRPGTYTLQAQIRHWLDVYGFTWTPPHTLEEARQIALLYGFTTLEKINTDHRTENPDCPNNLTWRKPFITQAAKKPIPETAPEDLFSP